jgi:hypothetical protein
LWSAGPGTCEAIEDLGVRAGCAHPIVLREIGVRPEPFDAFPAGLIPACGS